MQHWIEQSRALGEKNFAVIDWPAAKDEDYRFFSLPKQPAGAAASSSTAHELPRTGLETGESYLLVNGALSSAEFGAKPGKIFSLHDEVARTCSLPPFTDVFARDKYAQLAAARWTNGAYARIEEGSAGLLRVLDHHDLSQEFRRNLFYVAEGVSTVIVQECRGDDQERFLSELTEIHVAQGAKLHWVLLQGAGAGTEGFQRFSVNLAEGSELKMTPLFSGGKNIQTRVEVNFEGAGAKAEIKGAVSGSGTQAYDLWFDLLHRESSSQSNMDFNFVMSGKSKATINGLIHVSQGTMNVEASQKARTLLLEAGASVNAIPKLIIQTDEVKCGHGASVTTINPEQLHYLQCRGIPEEMARDMIVRGFFSPVISNLPSEALRARVLGSIANVKGRDLDV